MAIGQNHKSSVIVLTLGIFDSGVGGLSILSEINRLIPEAGTIYLADQAFAPYGNQSPHTIRKRTLAVINFLQDQGANLIVIACNTATLQSDINSLRETTSIPLVGIEPPVKPLAQLTKTNHAAIFCTKATADSRWLKKSVNQHAPHLYLQIIPAPNWVNLVESLEFTNAQSRRSIKKSLDLLHPNTDVIGLGCTHYSFLLPHIRHILPSDIQIVDTVQAIANHTQSILQGHALRNITPLKSTFFTTGNPNKLSTSLSVLLGIESPVKSAQL